jgi:hypothetical protein
VATFNDKYELISISRFNELVKGFTRFCAFHFWHELRFRDENYRRFEMVKIPENALFKLRLTNGGKESLLAADFDTDCNEVVALVNRNR